MMKRAKQANMWSSLTLNECSKLEADSMRPRDLSVTALHARSGNLPDILTDWRDPRTADVVVTRFCVAALQSFLLDPIRLDTQPCAWVDMIVRTIGTMLTAPTCRASRPMPTETSINLAQDSLSSPRTLIIVSISIKIASDHWVKAKLHSS